jgi:hypothetical protein
MATPAPLVEAKADGQPPVFAAAAGGLARGTRPDAATANVEADHLGDLTYREFPVRGPVESATHGVTTGAPKRPSSRR